MALTESDMRMPLGAKIPKFKLLSVSGAEFNSEILHHQAALIVFICNHCPYVIHLRDALNLVCAELKKKGIHCLAVNSNDAEQYPADSYEKMKEESNYFNYHFEYLYDETQEVAKSFNAVCTPDFYLFDENNELYYRGQFDGSRPGNSLKPDGVDLLAAVEQMNAGRKPFEQGSPSIGCSIKWKK
ncbi:MAG: thioredoxin family protein [Oligoflexales bacterium]